MAGMSQGQYSVLEIDEMGKRIVEAIILKYESAISGFTRSATRNTKLIG